MTARIVREMFRCGTAAGVAMIPFAAVFRAQGLRVNEYGRKTLALLVGDVSPPLHTLLTFGQHLMISWCAALPLLWALARMGDARIRFAAGAAYGAAFYVLVNAWALPRLFGDPLPWQLGFATVYPSLVIHLVYGLVIGWLARAHQPGIAESGAQQA